MRRLPTGAVPFWDKINFCDTGNLLLELGHNIAKAVLPVGKASFRVVMRSLYFCLRLLVVAVAFPVILTCIVVIIVIHPIATVRNGFRPPLRLWMGVLDWAKGIPVGYSYWEQYQAPSMLDEIAVHHDD
jgi:hypothetical protein